ncbi:MAG: disulfide bond formation protein B [Pseudomonadota bacterium]|nr:disulfide bond formation protein B [Pseudomonadota bacterium]
MFSQQTPRDSALAIAALAFVTIAGAWIFEYAGYPPCDLCLEQRFAYYAGVPLGLLIAAAVGARAPRALVSAGFALLAAIFLYNAGLAIYHSGVEAKYWTGPTACTGGALAPAGGDLLKQLETVKVVRCDEVNLRVFGFSLANWNILISAALAALAAAALLRKGR